jgi:hypothetical protein
LRQRPTRYAIRAGRNFTGIPCFQRRRLSLHLTRAPVGAHPADRLCRSTAP